MRFLPNKTFGTHQELLIITHRKTYFTDKSLKALIINIKTMQTWNFFNMWYFQIIINSLSAKNEARHFHKKIRARGKNMNMTFDSYAQGNDIFSVDIYIQTNIYICMCISFHVFFLPLTAFIVCLFLFVLTKKYYVLQKHE